MLKKYFEPFWLTLDWKRVRFTGIPEQKQIVEWNHETGNVWVFVTPLNTVAMVTQGRQRLP